MTLEEKEKKKSGKRREKRRKNTRGEDKSLTVYHFCVVLVDCLPRARGRESRKKEKERQKKRERERERESGKKGTEGLQELETLRYNQFASNFRRASGGPRRRSSTRMTKKESAVESERKKVRRGREA